MITKQEILTIAEDQDLLPTTIEKDYAIGWMLSGLSGQDSLNYWVFKGGTCLKKCYFETYRFSEDLDFTLLRDNPYDSDYIKQSLQEVAEIVTEKSGINFFPEQIQIEEYENKRHNISFQCKVAYHGPLSLPKKSLQRIKFDLTNDEVVVDVPELRQVNHTYSDMQNSPTHVLCYSINDILAEKTRALYERNARARDLYDIIHINRNFRHLINIKKALNSLKMKFNYKKLPEPTVELILSVVDKDLLASEWENQLGHQLPTLPPVENFIDDLPEALAWWIEPKKKVAAIPGIVSRDVATVIKKPSFSPPTQIQRLGLGKPITGFPISVSGLMNKIRYAARNNLMVKIRYKDKQRLVEPYSLRRLKTGNLLLYVFEKRSNGTVTNQIKAYNVIKIQNATVTEQSFIPKYTVEL